MGIKVLDWTMWQMGPVSTVMMGDMGADVIKIESLEGDDGRSLRRSTTMRTGLEGGRNAYFETNNRNKAKHSGQFEDHRGQRVGL